MPSNKTDLQFPAFWDKNQNPNFWAISKIEIYCLKSVHKNASIYAAQAT